MTAFDAIVQQAAAHHGGVDAIEARMTMLGRNYQDLLTLIHTDDGWRILTKVFSFVERKD